MTRGDAIAQISVSLSYADIQELAVSCRREQARSRAIARMFAVLSGQDHLEEVLWFYYQRRLAVARECWVLSRHVYSRTAYRNLKNDQPRYRARLAYKAEHKRKRRAMTSRGYARGERSGAAKLSERDVREILASSETGAALARKFVVSQATISGIRARTKWAHVQIDSNDGGSSG